MGKVGNINLISCVWYAWVNVYNYRFVFQMFTILSKTLSKLEWFQMSAIKMLNQSQSSMNPGEKYLFVIRNQFNHKFQSQLKLVQWNWNLLILLLKRRFLNLSQKKLVNQCDKIKSTIKTCHFSLQYNRWKMKIYVHTKELLRKCDQLNFNLFVKLLNFVNVSENSFFRQINVQLFISKVMNCIFAMTRMYFFIVKNPMNHIHLIAKKISWNHFTVNL